LFLSHELPFCSSMRARKLAILHSTFAWRSVCCFFNLCCIGSVVQRFEQLSSNNFRLITSIFVLIGSIYLMFLIFLHTTLQINITWQLGNRISQRQVVDINKGRFTATSIKYDWLDRFLFRNNCMIEDNDILIAIGSARGAQKRHVEKVASCRL